MFNHFRAIDISAAGSRVPLYMLPTLIGSTPDTAPPPCLPLVANRRRDKTIVVNQWAKTEAMHRSCKLIAIFDFVFAFCFLCECNKHILSNSSHCYCLLVVYLFVVSFGCLLSFGSWLRMPTAAGGNCNPHASF